MSRQRGIGVAVVVVGLVLLGFGWGRFAAAKSSAPTPPTIDQIVGNWSTNDSKVEYDLTTGSEEKVSVKGTTTIAKIDDETVEITYPGTSSEEAYYSNGFLLAGASNSAGGEFGSKSGAGYLLFTGSPGKLTASGTGIKYSVDDIYLDVVTHSLKQG